MRLSLIMQTPYHSSLTSRVIILNKSYATANFILELFLIPRFHKETSIITKNLRSNYLYIWNLSLYYGYCHFINCFYD